MRLATFNILNGRSPSDGLVDLDRFGRAIAALDADVLGLQEVDRDQPRSGLADLTTIAAEAMGATEQRFVAALVGTPDGWRPATGAEPAGVPSYGISLLSRHPVIGWDVVRLPGAGGRLPHRFPGDRRRRWVEDEPRLAVLAVVDGPDGRLRVVTTHLSFLPFSNGRQLRRLLGSLRPAEEPTVLLGDLNLGPRRARRLTRMHPLAEGATFPAHRPTVQLDHVLADRPLSTSYAGPVALETSDHRALVVDLLPGN